jgi:hypothetical protein
LKKLLVLGVDHATVGRDLEAGARRLRRELE